MQTPTKRAPRVKDGLNRCDYCQCVVPSDKTVNIRDDKTDTMQSYCSWECVEEFERALSRPCWPSCREVSREMRER